MAQEYEYAVGFLNEIKKSYAKLKALCSNYERNHKAFFHRIGLDQCAFNIEIHPDYPEPSIFMVANLSDRDRRILGEYLGSREKMYLLEQCFRSIPDEDTRRIARAYYLEGKKQPEIAAEAGRSRSYVSKKLAKAEEGSMAETIDRYFDWKYGIPGGKTCFWAGEWEKRYMRNRDARRGIYRFPQIPGLKELRRLGF